MTLAQFHTSSDFVLPQKVFVNGPRKEAVQKLCITISSNLAKVMLLCTRNGYSVMVIQLQFVSNHPAAFLNQDTNTENTTEFKI